MLDKKKSVSTPHRRKLLVQNRWANRFLSCTDFLLSKIPRKKPLIPTQPKTILIANLGHMGDAVIMTSLLPILKQHYPISTISVLIGSWSLPVLKNHPCVDRIHIVDHWKLNRSQIPFLKKLLRYLKTRKQAIHELRSSGYDIAIDTYYYFPNAIPIVWRAKISARIGYTSGGFGPLLTHSVDWSNKDQPIAHYYFNLLNLLGISRESCCSLLRPNLPPLAKSGSQCLFEKSKIDPSKGYIVMHIGTGSTLKEWPVSKWRELVQHLQGFPIIFTGKGVREKEKIDSIIHQSDGCFNFADCLKWEEFVAIIKDARLLIGVDSVPGHIASAFDVPSVLIYAGMANVHHWAPMNKRCTILTHPVACAPCYRSRGCSTMACIRDISVQTVYEACLNQLSASLRKA